MLKINPKILLTWAQSSLDGFQSTHFESDMIDIDIYSKELSFIWLSIERSDAGAASVDFYS